jgi:hypothetical protein
VILITQEIVQVSRSAGQSISFQLTIFRPINRIDGWRSDLGGDSPRKKRGDNRVCGVKLMTVEELLNIVRLSSKEKRIVLIFKLIFFARERPKNSRLRVN